jgi:hypothetical protein
MAQRLCGCDRSNAQLNACANAVARTLPKLTLNIGDGGRMIYAPNGGNLFVDIRATVIKREFIRQFGEALWFTYADVACDRFIDLVSKHLLTFEVESRAIPRCFVVLATGYRFWDNGNYRFENEKAIVRVNASAERYETSFDSSAVYLKTCQHIAEVQSESWGDTRAHSDAGAIFTRVAMAMFTPIEISGLVAIIVEYVGSHLGLPSSGIRCNPGNPLRIPTCEESTKHLADVAIGLVLSGGTMSGAIWMGGANIVNEQNTCAIGVGSNVITIGDANSFVSIPGQLSTGITTGGRICSGGFYSAP